MGWGDVRYCFAMAILVIILIIIILPHIFVRSISRRCLQPIAIFMAYLIQLDVDVTGNITARLCEVRSEFNLFCTFKIMGWGDVRYCFAMAILVIILIIIILPHICVRSISRRCLAPLFCFHGNCGKVCPTDFDFFGLSRSTSCGCCSYQVSSISVWRVTCYDHFCVFKFSLPWKWPKC
jgi:hypothetical protein